MKIFILLLFLFASVAQLIAQGNKNISRIEFNSGTRSYREQIIFTPDSIIIFKEDFTGDKAPEIERRKTSDEEWSTLLHTLEAVTLSEVPNLKSPTMKRAYDAAAHGSIIISTRDNQSYTHAFDDDDPHEKFHPLMKQIKKITGKGKRKK